MFELTPASTLVISSTRIPLSGPFFSVSVFRGGVPVPEEEVAAALSHLREGNLKLCEYCVWRVEVASNELLRGTRQSALEGAIGIDVVLVSRWFSRCFVQQCNSMLWIQMKQLHSYTVQSKYMTSRLVQTY